MEWAGGFEFVAAICDCRFHLQRERRGPPRHRRNQMRCRKLRMVRHRIRPAHFQLHPIPPSRRHLLQHRIRLRRDELGDSISCEWKNRGPVQKKASLRGTAPSLAPKSTTEAKFLHALLGKQHGGYPKVCALRFFPPGASRYRYSQSQAFVAKCNSFWATRLRRNPVGQHA
jgi:hypothetical protein